MDAKRFDTSDPWRRGLRLNLASGDTERDVRAQAAYRRMRFAVGVLGISLPIVLMTIGILQEKPGEILASISAYAHYPVGKWFTGVMFIFSVFMGAYAAYDKLDDRLSSVAAVFAFLVALFPTTPELNPTPAEEFEGVVHNLAAGLLFLVFAIFSLCLFTRGTRNVALHARCGYVQLLCLVLLGGCAVLKGNDVTWVDENHLVLILEAIALGAFGISWLVKGLPEPAEVADKALEPQPAA